MQLNDITNAVIKQLKDTTAKKVYDDEVQQALEKGSFFVHVSLSDFKRLLGDNRLYSVTYTLVYFPETDNVSSEYTIMYHNICQSFSYLKVGNELLHIHKIERLGNGREDALLVSFNLEVNIKVIRELNGVLMENMEVNING